MKNRFRKALVWLTCAVMMMTLWTGTATAEGEKNTDFLGKPFPDFSVTDTEGKTFTLSEALKDHQAAMIVFWATWCGPCEREFPYLEEVYQKYGDRVAFIALNEEKRETEDEIKAYRAEHGLTIPMGHSEDDDLYRYIGGVYLPDTVVVDRFGNAVFFHDSAFKNPEDVARVLETFLGDGYTQTAVLKSIPGDTSTRAFPVSAARAIYPESGNYRKVVLDWKDQNGERPVSGWIIPEGDSVRLRIEIAADDNVSAMEFQDGLMDNCISIAKMLDPERGVYVYDQIIPDSTAEQQFSSAFLYDATVETDPKEIMVLLFRNEEAISVMTELLKQTGEAAVTSWKYAEEEKKQENALQAYIIHVVDQDNKPVPEVMVNFCTDSACIPNESDENGTVTFSGAPDVYHVQIVDAPDGYSWDESYDMYTTREYGEWVLRVRKD